MTGVVADNVKVPLPTRVWRPMTSIDGVEGLLEQTLLRSNRHYFYSQSCVLYD